MQIVIDIPEKLYEYAKANLIDSVDEALAIGAIADGTPLPKGHGRLVDADAFFEDICNDIDAMTKIGIAVDGDWLWEKLDDALGHAPTIIEADKAEDGIRDDY